MPKLKREFVSFRTPRCPYCGSHNINNPEFRYLACEVCMLDFSCKDCGEEWQEMFQKCRIYSNLWDIDYTDEIGFDPATELPAQ